MASKFRHRHYQAAQRYATGSNILIFPAVAEK